LQQWLPLGDSAVVASVARALKESFPYVRVFHSVEGWGFHFLASMTPIPHLSASELAEKLPPDAARDLMEWGPASSPQEQFAIVLSHEVSLDNLIQQAAKIRERRHYAGSREGTRTFAALVRTAISNSTLRKRRAQTWCGMTM
jgi:hypothetical protein